MVTPDEIHDEAYEQGYEDAMIEMWKYYPKKHEDHIEIANGIQLYPKDQTDMIFRGTHQTPKQQHENGWFLVWINPTKRNDILNMLATL